jgi:hypothetical protein
LRLTQIQYKFSVEWIYDDIGYTKENTVLVISEVNTRAKWSAAKVDSYWGAV